MFVYVFIYSLNFVDRCHKPRFQTLLPVTFTFAFSPKFTNGKVPSTRDFTCVKRLKKHTIIDFLIKTIKSIDKLNMHMKENTFELYLSWATVQIYLFTEHAPARSVAMVTKWMLVELTHMFTLKYVNHRSQNLSQTWHFIFCTVVVINILWTIYETVTILSFVNFWPWRTVPLSAMCQACFCCARLLSEFRSNITDGCSGCKLICL